MSGVRSCSGSRPRASITFTSPQAQLSACRNDYSVCYFRTSRLLYQLTLSHQGGSYPALLASLAKLDLLILDDWMRDPITYPNAQDLLEVLDDRYNRSSTLVASQVPVADWFARFPDPTVDDGILDRLIHNAYRLNLTGILNENLGRPTSCRPLDLL